MPHRYSRSHLGLIGRDFGSMSGTSTGLLSRGSQVRVLPGALRIQIARLETACRHPPTEVRHHCSCLAAVPGRYPRARSSSRTRPRTPTTAPASQPATVAHDIPSRSTLERESVRHRGARPSTRAAAAGPRSKAPATYPRRSVAPSGTFVSRMGSAVVASSSAPGIARFDRPSPCSPMSFGGVLGLIFVIQITFDRRWFDAQQRSAPRGGR
jgi:hypothetical protein